MIASGIKGPENASAGQVPNRKVFLAAIVLLAVCGVCYTLNLEKSALLALFLSVLLLASLGDPGGVLPRTRALRPGDSCGKYSGGRKSVALALDLRPQIRIDREFKEWCRRGESNPRPRDYETLALPLSYAGIRQFFMLRIRLRMCQGVVANGQAADLQTRQ